MAALIRSLITKMSKFLRFFWHQKSNLHKKTESMAEISAPSQKNYYDLLVWTLVDVIHVRFLWYKMFWKIKYYKSISLAWWFQQMQGVCRFSKSVWLECAIVWGKTCWILRKIRTFYTAIATKNTCSVYWGHVLMF